MQVLAPLERAPRLRSGTRGGFRFCPIAIEIAHGRSRLLPPRLSGRRPRRRAPFLWQRPRLPRGTQRPRLDRLQPLRSEEHTSELQSLMRISYAVFCLKKKKKTKITTTQHHTTRVDTRHIVTITQ